VSLYFSNIRTIEGFSYEKRTNTPPPPPPTPTPKFKIMKPPSIGASKSGNNNLLTIQKYSYNEVHGANSDIYKQLEKTTGTDKQQYLIDSSKNDFYDMSGLIFELKYSKYPNSTSKGGLRSNMVGSTNLNDSKIYQINDINDDYFFYVNGNGKNTGIYISVPNIIDASLKNINKLTLLYFKDPEKDFNSGKTGNIQNKFSNLGSISVKYLGTYA